MDWANHRRLRLRPRRVVEGCFMAGSVWTCSPREMLSNGRLL